MLYYHVCYIITFLKCDNITKSSIKYSSLSLAVLAALLVSCVNADDYDHIEVTAARIQVKVNEIPAPITVINSYYVTDIAHL
ncbi:hypothetical protein A9Q74_10165 [Colwellia sp. 39_35_sub15_T18]|nr:hypothetical protein A9Q74_10165 [Colwellia sp. 39_35_sub15_T18]